MTFLNYIKITKIISFYLNIKFKPNLNLKYQYKKTVLI